jgi:hypothetical protein
MLLKILTLAGAALAFWGFLNRAIGVARPVSPRAGAEDMVRCSACGAWRAKGADCACALPPTP